MSDYHFCVICRTCGSNTPVLRDPSNGKGRFIGPCVVHVQCKSCGATHEYENRRVSSMKFQTERGGE